jgi:HK97 gp10 family phage protein
MPYSKTASSATITITGLDEYLLKIQAAGNNIDDACKEAIDECLPIVEKAMKKGAERHKRSGAVVESIESVKAKKENNLIYGEVGIDTDKHPEAFHAVYQEYGDGHSPHFPDPFIRPAVDENRAEIKKIQCSVLKKRGVPVE